MTVSSVINLFRKLYPYTVDDTELLYWLTAVDRTVVIETLQPRSQTEIALPEYTAADNTELLIPSPYCDAYLFYMAGMCGLWALENDIYNNMMYAYTTMMSNFKSYISRTEKTVSSQSIRA